LDLKVDVALMEFTQKWGMVTGISFRTDGPPMMASSSTNGQIAFWNLEEKKVVSTFLAHNDGVFTLKFMPNEPLLLTTSLDNSLKLWICDKLDGTPRLLRYREGHLASPQFIRYHGAKGDAILSAGEDSSLRIFSTISETLKNGRVEDSTKEVQREKPKRFSSFCVVCEHDSLRKLCSSWIFFG
jgi:U3 small nucleolar RNA-associated protein 21